MSEAHIYILASVILWWAALLWSVKNSGRGIADAFGAGTVGMSVLGFQHHSLIVGMLGVLTLIPALLQATHIAFKDRSNSYVEWLTALLLSSTIIANVV